MPKENIKEILENYKEETKRHFDVVAERIEDKIKIVIAKLDIEFIKNELKQKVGRDEFAALERRVAILEAKLKK